MQESCCDAEDVESTAPWTQRIHDLIIFKPRASKMPNYLSEFFWNAMLIRSQRRGFFGTRMGSGKVLPACPCHEARLCPKV
jgi:hypothetical protein